MTTMSYRKQDEAVAALVDMPPLLAEVGAGFERIRQQILALAPSIARMMEPIAQAQAEFVEGR